MKKLVCFILAGLMVVGISSCQGEDPNQEASGLFADNEFMSLVTQTFNEIGIDIGAKDIKIESDTENHGVRSVSVEILYDDLEMCFSCFYTSETWSPVSISDVETDKYYWLSPSVEIYEDVYDWKTGEIISEETEKFPETSPSNSVSPLNIELEMEYDENNYCRFMLEEENDEMSAIGVCQFDGLDPQLETVRSLAFTTYCVQNANVFSNGNLTMFYYSGEDDGFARYENGEIGLSDFPGEWNIYASDITQDQIEEEMQNIIDSIE